MNYFFKFLLPQLIEFFDKNNDDVLDFIPAIIKNNYQNEIKKVINFNQKNMIFNNKIYYKIKDYFVF